MTDDARRALEDARHVLFAVARDLQTSWRQSTVDTLNGGIRAIDTALAAPASGRDEGVAEALAAQPSTAENPNEDAYQRGRFDGIMEYAKVIAALRTTPASGSGWREERERIVAWLRKQAAYVDSITLDQAANAIEQRSHDRENWK